MLILANLILTGNQQWESAEWKRTRKSLGFWVAPPANWVPLHLYHQKNGSQFPKKSSHPKQLFPPMYITIIAGTLVTVLGTQVLSQGKVCSTSWSKTSPHSHVILLLESPRIAKQHSLVYCTFTIKYHMYNTLQYQEILCMILQNNKIQYNTTQYNFRSLSASARCNF